MAGKKGSTTKAQGEDLDALAHHIAEAFRIMDASESIPNYVYNAFADALNNLYNLVNGDNLVHSEPHIRLYLAALAKKGGAD